MKLQLIINYVLKIKKNLQFLNCLKVQKYKEYTYKKAICQYVIKKFYGIYTNKKVRYTDYENVFSKYTLNSKFIDY